MAFRHSWWHFTSAWVVRWISLGINPLVPLMDFLLRCMLPRLRDNRRQRVDFARAFDQSAVRNRIVNEDYAVALLQLLECHELC